MKIKAIIFDMGGVLNQGLPEFIPCFKAHGITLKQDLFAHTECKQLITDFQTGQYASPDAFFEDIRTEAPLEKHITFQQFKSAWNAAIISLNFDLLDNLNLLKQQGYRLFILSDTNLLHKEYNDTLYQQTYPNQSIEALFEKCYFSHETGNLKGFVGAKANQAWLQILQENHLEPHSCLFIDDKQEYIRKAEKLGLVGLQYTYDESASSLLHTLAIMQQNTN